VILEAGGLLLFTLVGGFLLWPLVRAALRQRRVQAWPQVTGFVTAQQSRVVQDAYFPEHQVRIQLAGRETVAWCGSPDRAGITGHYSGRGPRPRPDLAAQRVLERHPVGQTIVVRVNPRDHAEAYRVERELPLTLIAGLATAAFAALFGVAIAWIRLLP
jgi:hypothetical protein